MRVYLYDFLRFYCSFNNINEIKKQLIIAFEPEEINIILNNLGKKVRINNIRDLGNVYENEIIINKRQRLYFDTIGIFKKCQNIEVKFNACELTSRDVNFNLFFEYLGLIINGQSAINIGYIYDLLVDIKNNKYNNILAEFNNKCDNSDLINSDLINIIYGYYKNNKNIKIFYDRENMLIKLNYDYDFKYCELLININKKYFENDGYNIFTYIYDYLDFESEMLDKN